MGVEMATEEHVQDADAVPKARKGHIGPEGVRRDLVSNAQAVVDCFSRDI